MPGYDSGMTELNREEILRVLSWATDCDGESFIDERDWPLIEKLAAAVDQDPALVAPGYAREVHDSGGSFKLVDTHITVNGVLLTDQ